MKTLRVGVVKIYLKTRSGKWILINNKLEHVVIRGKRKSIRYIFAGESTDPPNYTNIKRSIKLPATIINKLISTLLDKKRNKLIITIEPTNESHYIVKIVEEEPGFIDTIINEITSKSKLRVSKDEDAA